jgi:outer membrane receptor protein involved in Fe transport
LRGLYSFGDDNATTHLYNNSFNGIPVDYVEVFINNDRQKNYGGNVQLYWKKHYGKLSTSSFASLSYVGGTIDEGPEERLEIGKDKQLDFIAPFILRLGTDLKAGKFSCSPRLILMGKQHISGISDTTSAIIKRQTISGYALLNISLRYDIVKKVSIFANVTNALNQRYKAVGFNMDLNKTDSDIFYDGQRQDPIRIMGGISVSL